MTLGRASSLRPGVRLRRLVLFWATGILCSFLDNAPTYLVFFNTAGGDAELLMGQLGPTLLAISAGAVFMGANTYIGNAPNFMVRSIADEAGVKMPSFFGYMAWSAAILLPCSPSRHWSFSYRGRRLTACMIAGRPIADRRFVGPSRNVGQSRRTGRV